MEGEQGRRPVLFEFGMETERNDDTTDQAGWGSESTWSLSADSLHENVKDQQGGDVKDDVPFTDSGYKSALNLEHSLNVQPDLEKSPDPPDVDSSSARADGDDNDAKTLYSLGTTVNPGHARNYIMELAKDIHSNLHRAVGAKDLTVLSNVLPQLLKAFAIKLCHDAPTRVNRRIMHFIHKRHQ
jgi:hypothetical protein